MINISYGRWELNIFVFFRTRIITSVGSDDVTANTRLDVSLRNNFIHHLTMRSRYESRTGTIAANIS